MPSAEVLAAIAKFREAQAEIRKVKLEEDAKVCNKPPPPIVAVEVESANEVKQSEEISNEDLSHHETSHDNLEYNGIRYDKLSAEDLIGKEFATVEAAEFFYFAYARSMGFDVRKDDKRTSTKTGGVTIRRWVCAAEGQRRNTDNKKRVRTPKKLTRFNCPCLFKIKYSMMNDSYIVDKFIIDHSHGLAKPQESHLLVSHRNVTDSQLAKAVSMRKVSIKACHAFQHMVDESGGFDHVGFTIKDLYNKLDSCRREILVEGDAKAAIAYLNGKAVEDENLFFRHTTDKNKRLANLFWRDSTSLLDYSCFGDVLVFDSTYKTNHYGKPLVLFVGSNNHLLSTVFGFALLVDEKAETYTWLLETFLESMNGRKPRAILTDGCESMRKAIELVIPGCPHRLCSWHVSRNAQHNLRNPQIVSEFRRCMFDQITVCTFEQRWKAMVNKHKLQNRRWVKMMYDKRHTWAEAFVSGYFFARMRSTQRCEGMNRYMKESLRYSGVKIIELIQQLDTALKRLRNKVVQEDFRSNNSTPVLSTQLRKLEKHASTIYTDNVFQLVCMEIDRVGELITSRIMHMDSFRMYVTSSYNHDEVTECTTSYYHQKSVPKIVCSCELFENEGIPCSHVFNVMKHERIEAIPDSLVLKRWTKGAKSEVHSTVHLKNMSTDALLLSRHGDLSYLGSKVSYLASQTEEGTDILKKEFNRLQPILTDVLEQQRDGCDNPGLGDNIVRDPLKVRSKGMRVSKEHKTRPKCSLCRSYGHNKSICPQKSRLRGRVRVVARNYTRNSEEAQEFPPRKKRKFRRLSDIED